jgi:FMN reductase
MESAVSVIGLGGSLRKGSTSLAALQITLDAAAKAGASTRLFAVGELDLPMYRPGMDVPPTAQALLDAAATAQGMVWSSPTYNGSVSGSFKNAIDWLHLLGDHDPPYLTDQVIGLVTTAGGTQGLQAINTMEFIVRALRAWAVPMVLPVARAWQAFDEDGRIQDDLVEGQLSALGAEVVRAARQMGVDGRCDYSEPWQ